MKSLQEKREKISKDIRRQFRQKTITQNRAWNELPSVIVQLPFRIDQSDWEQFDQLLDSIDSSDLQLLDNQLTNYIQNKYYEKRKQTKSQLCQFDIDVFNILRMIFRLRILDNSQFRTALKMMATFYQQTQNQTGSQATKNLLRVIKQMSIFLQYLAHNQQKNSFQLTLENQAQLNRLLSMLKLYRTNQEINKIGQKRELFNNYRAFYIYLLSLPQINLNQFIQNNNVGELFYVINDSLNHKQQIEIIISINIIVKLLSLDPQQSPQVRFCLKGLQILLIDGLERAKQFVSYSQNSTIQEIKFNFQGIFFSELLRVVNHCDVSSLLKLLQLLGQLFSYSDNFIKAVFQVYNKPKFIQNETEDGQQETSTLKIIHLKSRQWTTYQQFLTFYMTGLLSEIRAKVYWVISNILGSEQWFYRFGISFIRLIYLQDLLNQQKDNLQIQNQITICILNFLCNLNLEPKALDNLLEIAYKPKENQLVDQSSVNCFVYCLKVLINLFDKLNNQRQQSSKQTHNNSWTIFLQRAVYALHILLTEGKGNSHDNLFELIIHEIDKWRIGLYLEEIITQIVKKEKQLEVIEPIIENILKLIQQSKNHL